MSSRSTVLRARLHIADIDRGYYADHVLTLARHPSETDERVAMRLLAFILHAEAAPVFANGLSNEDEPDLWSKERTGDVSLWVLVGLPDPKRVRKATIRATHTVVYSYGGRAAQVWWEAHHKKLEALSSLTVIEVSATVSQALAVMVQRTMELNCTIQDGQIWIADDKVSVLVTMDVRKGD
ncbi:MAG TPA: YaeQ family protein [Acidiferrobacter sp.]|nr:YaeQ family protein [Acidiferrobacter sp.]